MNKIIKVITAFALILICSTQMHNEIKANANNTEIENNAMILEKKIDQKRQYTINIEGYPMDTVDFTFKGSYNFHKGTVNTVTDLILSITPKSTETKNGTYHVILDSWTYEIISTGIKVKMTVKIPIEKAEHKLNFFVEL